MADLRARYFCGGGVLHEVVERHASNGAEPSLHISKPNFNVLTNSLLGDGAGHVHVKQVHCRDADILTALEYLVGCWHVLVEHIRSNLRQCGMSDPGQVMLISLESSYVSQRAGVELPGSTAKKRPLAITITDMVRDRVTYS